MRLNLFIFLLSGNSESSNPSTSTKCGNCKPDFSVVSIDGQIHCLKYIATTSPLSQAVSICAKRGSKPPVPKNAKENADILDFFLTERAKAGKLFPAFALDLNDIKMEGTFVSSTGYKAVFTNWHNNEPDNKNGDEHYVTMYLDGTWNDFKSSTQSSIICQKVCEDKKDLFFSSG